MPSNILELTVSEFSRSIKRVLEDAFGYLKIKGEISGFKKASSGHLYFSLKDGDSILTAVCFRNMAQSINFDVADGLQVVASGRITAFEGRSNYQIIVEKLEIAGVGAMLEMIEKRRQKLLAEGLFNVEHKKPLPFFPKKIGVITSQTGAVIQDIRHRIEARCPSYIMLYSVTVQGQKAASEIIEALRFFHQLSKSERPEVLIIARGGGSFEDLLAFNDEELVREVFKSEIPIISAIGHETDVTLLDYVADLRAPTPTAAAEMATPVLADLVNHLDFLSQKLQFLPLNFLHEKVQFLNNLQRYMINPQDLILKGQERVLLAEKRLNNFVRDFFQQKIQKLDNLQVSYLAIISQINLIRQKIEFSFESLKSRFNNDLENKLNKLENLTKLLKSQHYQEVLKRGFALLKDGEGNLVTSVSEVKEGEEIVVEMVDGEIRARVD